MTAEALRILVVLPMYGGSLPIGRYCARTVCPSSVRARAQFPTPLYSAAIT